MSAVSYIAEFQQERSVGATRIEDKLYIFNGTYPVYYKGDGKLYLLPDYQTSFTDLENAGHNTLSSNFNKVYRYEEYKELEAKPNQFDADNFTIRDTDFAPIIPYRLDENSEPIENPFNIALSYSLPAEYKEPTTGFLPENYRGSFETLDDAFDDLNVLSLSDVVYLTNPTTLYPKKAFYKVQTEDQEDFFFNFESDLFVKNIGTNDAVTFNDIDSTSSQDIIKKAFVSSLARQEFKIQIGNPNSGFVTIYEYGELLDNDYEVKINESELTILYVDYIPGTGASSFYIDNKGFAKKDINFSNDEIRIIFGTSLKEVTSTDLNLKPLYEVFPIVYSRFPTTGSPWEKIPLTDYSYDIHNNASNDFDNLLANNLSSNVLPRTGILGEAENNIQIKFRNLSSEVKDYKVELVVQKRGYQTRLEQIIADGGLLASAYQTTDFVDEIVAFDEFIIEDLEPTAFQLEDFPTEEEPNRANFKLRALWSTNRVLEHYGKLIAYGSLEMPETLFVSFPENPTYFPANFTLKFNTDTDEFITSVHPFTQILVVQSENRTWGLKGTSSAVFLDANASVANENAYQVFDINTSIGAIASDSVRPVRNQLFFLSNEGLAALVSLYATDDRYNVRLMDRNIENIVPRSKRAIAIQHDNQYWLAFPETKEMFRYYIDKEAWVRDEFNHFKDFGGPVKFYRNDGKLRFITNPTLVKEDDNEYKMYEAVVDKSLPTDFTLNVPSEFITSDLDQSMPFHEKRYKELKMDFVIQNEYLPDLTAKPLTGEILEYNDGLYRYTFEANLTKNHKYSIAFPVGFYEDEAPEGYPETYKKISDLSIKVDNVEFEEFGIENSDLFFVVGSSDLTTLNEITVEFESEENFKTLWENAKPGVVDSTYDLRINSFVTVQSDGNFINQEAIRNYVPDETLLFNVLNNDLGTRFTNFTFGQTPFGDVAKTVQTVRLAGSGYGVSVFMKDESRSKWTLETLGIHYRMRKPRSR